MSRLSKENTQAPPNAPKGPASQQQSQQRPSRSQGNVRRVSGGESNGNGRRGGRTPNNGPRNTGKRGGGAKTASDLDAELDAFMKAPPSTAAMAESAHAPQPGPVSCFSELSSISGHL